MWPKILHGAFSLPTSPSPFLVTIATGYKEWMVVNLLLPIVSRFGCSLFPYLVQGLGHQLGPLWCLRVWCHVNSGILEELVSFVTALEHCLPTNVN